MTNGPADPAGNEAEYVGDRSYTAPFSDVWDTVLAAIGELREWRVLSSSSQAGTLRVETADLFGRRPLEAELRLSLDEMGMTRLQMRMDRSRRGLLPPAAPRRVGRLLASVDRRLRLPRGRTDRPA
jgi:hypothetical protein